MTGGDTGFQPSFKPDNVPKLSVPDVPEDATGLSPEDLAHVPTLTEQVGAAPEALPKPDDEPASEAPVLAISADTELLAVEQDTQEPEPEADTWVEHMQVRMDRLMDDIHTLNDRLDRLENKTKV
jgi:hypothetical protein